MLSSKMENALNEQINAEIWSGYLYLSMSLCAARHGLPGLSHWMHIQSHEELAHARRLQLYLLSQDAMVELRSIATVPVEWDDTQEILRVALMHEQEVTSMINERMTLAIDEHDFATMIQLQWFVNEQIEEEQQLRDLLATLDMVEESPCALYQIDQQLLQREK